MNGAAAAVSPQRIGTYRKSASNRNELRVVMRAATAGMVAQKPVAAQRQETSRQSACGGARKCIYACRKARRACAAGARETRQENVNRRCGAKNQEPSVAVNVWYMRDYGIRHPNATVEVYARAAHRQQVYAQCFTYKRVCVRYVECSVSRQSPIIQAK